MGVVDTSGSGHELTQDVNNIRNVRTSDAEIDKATDEVTIASWILKRDTVCGTKTSVKLHRSVHRAVISKTDTIKKIMNVLSLGQVVAVRSGCDLNPKKVAKRAQVRHVKLLIETSLNKGNILRIIPRDEHIIHIEKNKSTTTGGSVNEKSKIMLASNKPSSSDNRSEALKPSTRGLLEAIERTAEKTDVAIRNIVARRWVHVDLLLQLTVKKSILHVKLRDGPPTNRGHRNKSVNGSSVSNRSKGLLIVTTVLLQKTTGNKTSFIALNRAIRVGLDLKDPLARDWNGRRVRDKIPSAGTLKSSNLLEHSKLPLRISNNITIGGRLRKRDDRA
jgi:hypothetical protein